jgi:hypothetical protein
MTITTELEWHLLSEEKPVLKERDGYPAGAFGLFSEILVFMVPGGEALRGMAHKHVDEPDIRYATAGGFDTTPEYWAELTTPINP